MGGYGDSALTVASRNGHKDCARLLADAEAKKCRVALNHPADI
jgi:hypothetical protein